LSEGSGAGLEGAIIDNSIDFCVPATYLMLKLIEFHHFVLAIIIFVVITVIYVLLIATYKFKGNKVRRLNFFYPLPWYLEPVSQSYATYAILLEIVWTIIPSILLVFLAAPTFLGLYAFEKGHHIITDHTFKVIGNQWYWDYEYSDTQLTDEISFINAPNIAKPYAQDDAVFWISPEYPSYMLATDDLTLGELRLLEADSSLYIPVEKQIRFIITSNDVIHCFAVPSLGIKLDAVPGRLNQVLCVIKRIGNYYGQCSEICGVDHGFMPINLTVY
jgi:cytochrome c oxidase subunit II